MSLPISRYMSCWRFTRLDLIYSHGHELLEWHKNMKSDVDDLNSDFILILLKIYNGAKLGVAPVAHAPPLFLPRPELKYIYVNVVFQFSHIAILLVISTLWNLQQSPRGLTSFGTIFSYSDKIFWEICVIRFYFDNEICRNLQQSWIKQRQSCQNSMKTYYAPIWRFCVTFAWL